ncbi:MAG: hypothetical protein K2X56_09980 [Mycobacterium pseudokansasii]|nr:hypothetical protein [Mycobacterium pseudokansasii]
MTATIARIADSESPPRSKNDSSTPTRSGATPKNLNEDVDEDLLDRAVTIAVVVFRHREHPPADFTVGRERQRLQHHHRNRHHVRRQPLRQLRAYPGRVQRARERFGDITDQALVTGVLLTGDDHRLLDPGQVS